MICVTKITVGFLKENCYVVWHNNSYEAIVIDPGNDYKKIKSFIDENHLLVKAVFLTHGHFDHIGALEFFSKLNLPIYIHALDANKLTTDKNLGGKFGVVVPKISANMIFSGEEVKFCVANMEITAIHTPGHSKGSVCYLIEDCLFSGDTIFEHGYGRTDFYDGSFDELKQSIKKLSEYLKNTNIKLFAGH